MGRFHCAAEITGNPASPGLRKRRCVNCIVCDAMYWVIAKRFIVVYFEAVQKLMEFQSERDAIAF